MPALFLLGFSACNDTGVDPGCTEQTWCEDADADGLGNPDMSQSACDQPAGYVANNTDTDDTVVSSSLHAAFDEFSDNVTVMLDASEVVIETTGLPDHTSPYWSNTTARTTDGISTPAASVNHPLFVEPTVTSYADMAPGNIDNFNGMFTLTVPVSPSLATSSSATGLGPIGIAISGSVIYNDEEGPGVPLDGAVGGLDYSGAHTGPQSYHYHTQNDLYLGAYYILFPGDYQGTPNAIN